MFIDFKELALKPLVISTSLRPGVVDLKSKDITQHGQLNVEAVAELVSQEVRIRGHLAVQLQVPCSRCLEPLLVSIDKPFDLFYRSLKTIAREEEIELTDSDMHVVFFSGNGLEFNDVLAEQILIEVPMKAICREGCKGLCPQCGTNWNVESCPCAPKNSPFANLWTLRR